MYLMQDYLAEPLQAGEPLFGDMQWLAALLLFESELAHSQAECGVIPEAAARDIARACDAVKLDRAAFVAQARRTGAVGIALTKPLQQWLAEHAPDAQPWLHWGTTTQDAVDTAHALLTRAALNALHLELETLCDSLQKLAVTHAATPILARSLLQPALVTSFGFKCAQMLGAFRRSQHQLQAQASTALCVQLGGAVGNRAGMGAMAGQVEQVLARRLGLSVAGHAWHTQRDTWMRLGMEVAICGGSLAKLAKDWALMSQYEVGELHEATRGTTSSAMPHKRNPVHCMQAIAQTQSVAPMAGLLVGCMAQAHERALGEWQAEVAHWAALWQHTTAACRSLNLAAQGMVVVTKRMRRNVDGMQEVIFSEGFVQVLKPVLGSAKATALVAQQSEVALAEGRPLGALLQSAVEPLCAPDQWTRVRDAIAEVADLGCSVRASEQACQALLTQYAQPS